MDRGRDGWTGVCVRVCMYACICIISIIYIYIYSIYIYIIYIIYLYIYTYPEVLKPIKTMAFT